MVQVQRDSAFKAAVKDQSRSGLKRGVILAQGFMHSGDRKGKFWDESVLNRKGGLLIRVVFLSMVPLYYHCV